MTIGVIGESLVDVFLDASGTTVERPGGGPFNVAVALARLDIDVRLFTTMGDDEVRAIVDRYQGTALITYDPNWRDGLVAGDPRQIADGNVARADVVKLSDDDAAAIYPGVELDDLAHQLLDRGPALVVITKGAAGSSAWTAKNEKHVGAATADVIDTVGAGDAFMATLLSELAEFDRAKVESLNRRELELVLEFSSFVAGKTCERAGADPPYIADLF
jgi:fructokinase